ncbi:MAG: hypothetical protein HY840_07405 [Bacteroidetes bacterium]|nr:hypothetical protein [Bacteroidota bacterium]
MSKPKAQRQVKSSWIERLADHPSNPYKIIFFVCILLYAQILTFGLVHFDDHGFVLLSADTLKLSNIPKFFNHSVFWVMGDTNQNQDVFYRPLQNVLYAICNTIASGQAWIYHLAGLLLHIITSCVLFRFFKELKYHLSISLVFALIYAVHPVLVQGVVWIAGIGDQMVTLFSLLSAIYFMKLYSPDPKGSHPLIAHPLRQGLLHLFFLGCALFSKEVSIVLIPICLFWFLFIIKNKHAFKNLLITAVGWGGVAGMYFIFRNNAIPPVQENLIASAIESFKVNGPLALEYFEKIFLPYRLSPIPSREDAHLIMGGVIVLVLIVLFVFKKRFTRMSLFGLLWFIVFLFPTFIQQNPQANFFAFEHRLYLPFIGILIVTMELMNIPQINMQPFIQRYGFSALLILFFVVTFSYSKTFSESYSFYGRAISFSPRSVLAYNGYGRFLLEEKKYFEAVEVFKKSHEYKLDDLQTTGKIAEIYLKNLNDPKEAIVWFKKTIDIDANSVEAAVSIGDAYFNFLHDTANAIIWYEHALKINPHNEFASATLGVIYTGKGKNIEARKFLEQSLNTNPNNLLSLKWMAISYFNEGKISDALIYLNKAYKNYPDDIDLQRNLMICYYKLHDFSNTEKFAVEYSKSNNKIPAEIESYLKSNRR